MHKTLKKIKDIRKEKKTARKNTVIVGMNSCGIAAGAGEVYEKLESKIAENELNIELKKSGCLGACYAEPIVEVIGEGMPKVVYMDVDKEVAGDIISRHYHNKEIIQDHVYSSEQGLSLKDAGNLPEKERDKKIIFIKNTGVENGENIDKYLEIFRREIRDKNIRDRMQIVKTEVLDIYNKGISLKIWPDNIFYTGIKKEDIPGIVEKTVLNDKKISSLILEEKEAKYEKVVLKNCGKINPENINDYIGTGGYKGLEKALAGENIIEELKISGLRGRGGGGYPTWRKWEFARKMESGTKYIVCNGDEGDPGAYMDRSILEGDPHSILEGMIIAGMAVGANKGFIYIRAEYPLAIKRIYRAIDQAGDYNILGENILGSGFDFDIEVRLGAGAFVCGEETALLASIEGKRGTPRPRPPYPSVKGLWGEPTVINNVETLANVPRILVNGGDWFSKFGTEKSKGTKVFALTGKVKNSGLVEVPMGTTLNEIVYNLGGGLGSDSKIKAVQTGGPSGGVIPGDYLDTPVDYESLSELGSIMGSGGMIVMDGDDCMVDVAKFYLKFCVDESCGKCIPCRIGGYQLLNVLERITRGDGVKEDLEKIERISHTLAKASLCGLGQTAPNPVKSTLRYFKEEYIEHITENKCAAGKCGDLLDYSIDQQVCRKCDLCARNCPVGAITGNREEGYTISAEECTGCGECFEVCKFGAIIRE
ncbi:MAG: NADH-ubiquinone oxidoreductase-F iron-sulfur binding region domain-containing protein [Elusimicrobiota bacterium]